MCFGEPPLNHTGRYGGSDLINVPNLPGENPSDWIELIVTADLRYRAKSVSILRSVK